MEDREELIEITGAREHNLKNLNLTIPRNKFVVLTGLSGSGKSSLAFDTIFAEGQRRYVETLSAYARQFLGSMERPDVDKIEGLSPVISIEQKSVNKNPRSTVGTITEIYDFLRLLFARVGEAYSYITGDKMVRFTEQQIIELIIEKFTEQKIQILAPVVKGRKGHYRELFEQLRKSGFSKVRVDGELKELIPGLHADRYSVHDIEALIDRIEVSKGAMTRVIDAVRLALKHGKGMVLLIDGNDKPHFFSRHLMDPISGISYDDPAPNLFSFNSPYGACPKCNGLGEVLQIDEKKIIPFTHLSINEGAIVPLGKRKDSWMFRQIEGVAHRHGFDLDTPVSKIPAEALNHILYGTDELLKVRESFQRQSHSYSMDFEGIINFIERQSKESDSPKLIKWVAEFMNKAPCSECAGTRLKKESLFYKINGKNIAECSATDLIELRQWTGELDKMLSNKSKIIAREIIKEISNRIDFLLEIGLDYLHLNRSAQSLSGGEAQRIRLATQIGANLVGVLYILDEPSIGLHQRDNQKLIGSLKRLREAGNSVIVVEHDKEMMNTADWLIDMGPGAGAHGGKIVAEGTPENVRHSAGLTSLYLAGNKQIETPASRRKGSGKEIIIVNACGHNLKNMDISFPLGKFICITGVSGSGKSSLINQTLYPAISSHLYKSGLKPLLYESIKGIEHIDKIIEIDQSPIGRTPRSNPATYINLFSDIRNLFAGLPESKIRGYTPGRFSFNVVGGRCNQCRGAGMQKIEMNFMPDVYVQCSACNGRRYNRETLEVRFKGKSISDVLNLTVEQAMEFFKEIHFIASRLTTLFQVGLGYITLGQSSTTLSGGEAQRIKLSAELSRKQTGNTLYILDEPTTGLHFEDVKMLLDVLNWLVNLGNTVIVIEHNLDVIKTADYIIDLGPEGGDKGGYIVAEGTPEEVANSGKGYTSVYLRNELNGNT